MGFLTRLQRARRTLVIGLFAWVALLPAAQAHLMVAQRGTLNLVDGGAFMVLSIPVLAFQGIDDSGDGLLSSAEFGAHRQSIIGAVKQGVVLSDAQGPRELQGMMLSLAPPDHRGEGESEGPSSQLVVMGRFDLGEPGSPLRFQVNLFGQSAAEQVFRVTASRADKSEQHLMTLTPQQPSADMFPSAWQTFADCVKLGAQHIFEGPDHLLFLLVVLAAGWGWRHVLGALTLFTLGHAVTLVLSLKGVVSVPASVVEPAIAATIVGMAAFDAIARYRGHRPPRWLLFGLVFGCALIHGLGLGAALSELGLDRLHQLPSLAGFNLGIELAQLAVALVMVMLALAVQRWRGDGGLQLATRLVGVMAMAMGLIWLVQRLSSLA
ncbi:hypothetical protein LPB72_01095 [Hydrogenophaga crassostreae]|uniref:HupE / UreJ protein n=1 Tax=Hydrogenophaga crassostreae TaxID=1763535 RepID=A0A162T7L7_9BURK|nr:HupE/UreJ family protein [Hydrogenophaga crassostreae]AOW13902.1 hypothetical protein LPB072_14720 [Hydrogenophaga crassostreae]OAD44134.1 hypothetical protein LPB72_01095 [Hydrogenophaga crassostreae]